VTIRNLDQLFRPRSVALIGASSRPGSIGAVLARNIFRGDFDGPILPVNPKHRYLHWVWAYPDVASLPATPELAVIATPPQAVPGIVGELAARGTRAAVVITAGFAEAWGGDGEALQQAMLDAAKPHNLRIVGPNCLGILVPGIGLNASFAHLSPRPGRLAFVTQSGATVTAILDWAAARGIGFSHLVSLGDMADVDFGDMLDYLANDRDTQAILLYIEAVCNGRKFMSAARAAARVKPVIVVKAGRHAEGARAAASHTGALAGADAVYDAVFRRAGMLRVYTLEELFDAAETLSMGRRPKGSRLAVLTNGGGIGVLAADAVVEAGARLAELSVDTLAGLDAVLPRTWSHANPVDIIGDAPASRYAQALRLLTEDKCLDAVLVLHCPTAVASATEAAQAVVDAHQRDPRPMLLTSWVGETAVAEARRLFAARQVPTYNTPEQAVRAFMYLVSYRRNQEMLMETPPSVPESFTPDVAAARRILAQALAEDRWWLLEHEAKALLDAYGVPVVPTRLAGTADEAAAVAAQLGGPVVLKVVSPDITHKSDVGGVALDLAGPTAVKAAAAAMRRHVLPAQPESRLTGFSVQPMVHRPGAYELIVGATEDQQFGPVLLFGQGGTSAELVKDQALALPPLNLHLAHELMSRTRVHDLLQGYRGAPAANLEAIAITLIRVAQLVTDHAEVRELDINPLVADAYGVIALDARVRVVRTARPPAERLAIRPYPRELEEEIPLGDGRTLLLRPIRPEDEPSLQAALASMTAEEIRLRFLVPVKTLSHIAAVRFTQLDYDREMGLILTEPGIAGQTPIYGVVNIIADPDNERAEYAIIVRHDMTALGLGTFLMRRIIDYARARGIREIWGDVLQENQPMLRLCRTLGFTEARVPDDPTLVRVTLRL
jgi:acetyltransferase